MIDSDHTKISSAEEQLIDILAQEAKKMICVFSFEGTVLYVSKNSKDLFPEIPTRKPIEISIEGFSTIKKALSNLLPDNLKESVFNGSIKVQQIDVPVKGKLVMSNLSEFVICFFNRKNSINAHNIQKKIIDNTSDVIAYYNSEEELVYISPSIYQLTGYTQEEIIQMQQLNLSHPEDKDRIEALLKNDIASSLTQNRFTYRIKHKDGSFNWVEVVSRRNYDENGNLLEAILNFRSIQEQVETEQRLHDAEQLYASIVNQAPFGVVIHDKQKVLFANNAAATIVKAESSKDVLGLELQKMVHPKDRDVVANRIEQLQENNLAPLRDERFLCFDGSYVDVEVMGSAVKFRNSDCVQVLFWDISQRKQVEALLREQEYKISKIGNELDKFLYSTAHDLRAPIASALGLLNLCEQDSDINNVQGYFDMLKQSIQKLDSFIGDISDLSRNAKAELIIELIDPVICTERAIEILRPLKIERKVQVEVDWNQASELRTDKERFQIILNNLFSNILRYYNPSNEIVDVKVSGKVDDNSCVFSIADNGIGIPKEHIDKIYDMFYRAHDTKAGSGLGLYIVKETVEKLGGSIKVESDTRLGTVFTIVIPNNLNR